MAALTKDSVLVLGGVGFVGRNFVKYLLDNDLCSHITVADKQIPQIAFMSTDQEACFDNDKVTFIQTDLTKDAHLDRVFGSDKSYDFVFNLAAETRYGQPAALYDDRCRLLSKKCAERAKSSGVKRFVEMSTALVYKPQTRKASTEGEGVIAPWTDQATAKLAAEQEVLGVEGLDVVILRPAFIWGPGDVNGLMPRIVCAAAYVELKETMKFLWDTKMRVNTVHVEDVCRALFHVTKDRIKSASIYNLVDKNDTDQGKTNKLMADLFGIKTGFHGIIISNLARLALNEVIQTANDKHMQPWDTICRSHKILTTPLSPYMSKDLLSNNSLFVDGSKIEKETGFSYAVPTIEEDKLREAVQAAIDIEIFPPILKAK